MLQIGAKLMATNFVSSLFEKRSLDSIIDKDKINMAAEMAFKAIEIYEKMNQ